MCVLTYQEQCLSHVALRLQRCCLLVQQHVLRAICQKSIAVQLVHLSIHSLVVALHQ